MTEPRGFFADLFDTSFREFITPRIARVVYILLMVLAAFWAVGAFLAAASKGGLSVVAGLVVAPVVFLLGVVGARIYLELVLVIFRIAENTAPQARSASVPPPAP